MIKSLGAVFMAYKNVNATDFVIENFRKYFPESPIYLFSDGGDDLSSLAQKYENIGYSWVPNILGNEINNYIKLPYESFRMREFWNRQKIAVEFCNTDYMIILEDDVLTISGFNIDKDFDAIGLSGPYLSNSMINDIKNGSNQEVLRYGMCGGAMYNSKVFLNIYDDVIEDIESHHDEQIRNNEYFLLGAADANLVYHFAKRSYKYEQSPWLSQFGSTPDALSYPLVHNYKSMYERKTSNGSFI
jgi:hypothetical protein